MMTETFPAKPITRYFNETSMKKGTLSLDLHEPGATNIRFSYVCAHNRCMNNYEIKTADIDLYALS